MSLTALLTRSKAEAESWRYTDLPALLARDAPAGTRTAISALPSITTSAAGRHQLVFINGVYVAAQSTLPHLPADLLQGDAVNGYRLDFQAQICLVTSPLELVFVGANESSTQLTITLGASTRLTLIEHHLGDTAAAQVIDTTITLGPQAKLVHGKLLHGQPQGAHLAHTAVTVAAGASYRNFALIKDTQLVRNEIEVRLADPQAQCSLDGVMLLRGNQHADTTTRIIHAAPHGTSGQLYKSVLLDRSRGVFQGRVKVCAQAQKTDAAQLSRALLLSDQAEMDAKPELNIDADDVKCSHGCTVGELESEALFYLRARGIPEREARALLLRSFVAEAVEAIEVADWRAYALAESERWLREHA